MDVDRATDADWPAVRELLVEAGLTLDGAAEAFATGVVAKEARRLVGCAAIEPYREAALLRSVAVAPDRRAAGVGTTLIRTIEGLARDGGATRLILLTETAEPWFSRLGYNAIDRSLVPSEVAGSGEFVSACSTSAIAMHRSLV
jgi:amino-acid N-acetyltransferase